MISRLNSLETNPYIALEKWQAGCYEKWQTQDREISSLGRSLLLQSEIDLVSSIQTIKYQGKNLELSRWQRILVKVLEFATRIFFSSYNAIFQSMLDRDLKGRKIQEIADWILDELDNVQAVEIGKGQLALLVGQTDPEQLHKLYEELSFSRDVLANHQELCTLTKMDKSQVLEHTISQNLALRLSCILRRSEKHDWCEYLKTNRNLTPTLWELLNKEEEGQSLLQCLLEEESFFLKKATEKFNVNAENISSKKTLKLEHFINAYYEREGIIDTSLNRLQNAGSVESIAAACAAKPLRITHVGVEYSALWKQGGLAEAIQGIAEGQKKVNPSSSLRLVFPFYSTIRPLVDSLGVTIRKTDHETRKGEKYYAFEFIYHDIEFVLIDHTAFELNGESPSIYQGSYQTRNRFATFCNLAKDWLYENREQIDIIHLHDWHVASIVDHLQKHHRQEWLAGKIPGIVFTFHNNARVAQGRADDPHVAGAYSYGLGANPMVSALRHSDMITTVSPRFSLEVQTPVFSEGLHTVMQIIAAQRRFIGIINGSNPDYYNPKADINLRAWRLHESDKEHDLTYGPNDAPLTIIAKQFEAKTCLAEWIRQQAGITHQTPQLLGKINPHLPIVLYVGRYDSHQKGMSDFEKVIEVCLQQGAQVIFVGSQEDQEASKILDSLQKKYATHDGVVILRDYRFENNKFRYQQGSSLNAPIGSLVRAAADVLIVPSRFEPCGLVQFESWLFGRPVIARECGGLADTVKTIEAVGEDGFNGWLFGNDNDGKNSLSNTIRSAIRHLNGLSSEERGTLFSRLMNQARQQGWASSSTNPSPVHQYFIVYDEALKRRFKRQNFLAYRLQDLVDRVSLTSINYGGQSLQLMDQVESNYVKSWFLGCGDTDTYERYTSLIHSLPAPYGQKVRTDLYKEFGPQPKPNGGFRLKVLAPAAKSVEMLIYNSGGTLVEDRAFTKYKDGTWMLEVDLPVGTLYRLHVNGVAKLDPFARASTRLNSKEAPFCVVYHDDYQWSDQFWIQNRSKNNQLNDARILEIHPNTWLNDPSIKSWADLAPYLIEHMKAYDFTHVELMAVMSHPFLPSLGYQVDSYYALNERLGGPSEFKELINALHQANLGVIIDFVPGHCATDSWGIGNFDGTAQFETSGLSKISIQSIFYNWGHQMDLANPQTVNLLLSSLMMFAREYHIDGFRIDAVKSILYHYDVKAAQTFLRHLNCCLEMEFPDCFTVAEDYSSDSRVVAPVNANGLGFTGRWNINWKDVWKGVLSMTPSQRLSSYARSQVFSSLINQSRQKNQVAYLSHDEFKPEDSCMLELAKGSLSLDERVNQVKTVLAQQRLVPGASLLFMGCERLSIRRWHLHQNIDSKVEFEVPRDIERQFYKSLASLRLRLGRIEQIINLQAKGQGLQYQYDLIGSKETDRVVVNITDQPLPLGVETQVGNDVLFSTCESPVIDNTLKPFSLMVVKTNYSHKASLDAIDFVGDASVPCGQLVEIQAITLSKA